MQAFVLEKYGAPLREVSIPEPVPSPNEVLVRMVASGVNHADERTRAGEFKTVFRLDLPKVMGGELSGEVIGLGADVTGNDSLIWPHRDGLIWPRVRHTGAVVTV